ncbi:MAG: hypothetical protein EOP83_00570 [Verrucomicrobiaceae bacterium]|nr:MAG: hypothetical protein EOP83_00570 [Verrucomicrobiaceae bacterium]
MNRLGGFGAFLIALDRYLVQRTQTVYDYLLDRFGMYVGTFRAGIFLTAMAEGVIYDLFVTKDGVMTMPWVITQVVWVSIVYFLTLRPHLGEEWLDQDKGKYERLNLKALSHQGTGGLVMRGMIVTVFSILLALTASEVSLNSLFNMAMMVFWSYSLAACVRDRDESRFRQLHYAHQTGM